MKRLTWQFRRLQACDGKLPSHFMSCLTACFAFIISSCQYLDRQSAPVSERMEFRTLRLNEGARVIAHASEKGCAQNIPHFWLIEFQSAFGSHQIKLDYSLHKAGEETLVIFNQHRFRAQIPLPASSPKIKEICSKAVSQTDSIIISAANSDFQIKTILETITPNCQVEFRDDVIYCHLPFYDAGDALRRLTETHHRLVTRWQRHPYLLSRRIAFARNLALAINGSEPQVKMDRICRIVKYSIPEELPLAIRSSRWFQAACLNADPINKEALLVSLYDAIREIENLTEELTSSSRVGMFSLRLPQADSPNRSYWITLKPLTVDRASDEQLSIARKSACWHPLYDQSMAEHHIADELGLLAKPVGGACSLVAREDDEYLDTLAVRYVKNSIASETEFPLSNGRGKVLRLPKGEYHYTIEAQSGPFVDIYYPNNENPESSTGIVSWINARPHPTITSW